MIRVQRCRRILKIAPFCLAIDLTHTSQFLGERNGPVRFMTSVLGFRQTIRENKAEQGS